ncbi:multi-copper oxidase laccase-like protein [Melampsora larici-populina 98AG31]|uniref:Multi-copper oxidase laccase-like protein n=1 Tax=Melampsora larici-populina (strain 98AG31 / pathotype 3-4-7) TaxID=747676 RepID=F4R856_MELLP|nr:multi-copper oxidase laccase-like protein [Melampsora larici-populina 98AG31]EGG11671.1 multi-copper oxidase laccase-like protein [Melampsora larici-populina 98AG31]
MDRLAYFFLFSFILRFTIQHPGLLATQHRGLSLNTPKPEYQLDPNFEINSKGITRKFVLEVTNITASPDGFLRRVLVINKHMPGPLIEANDGDNLEITVINQLDSPLSFHWHGLHQNGTNWEDGITAVTQCPIPASGGRYTYKFQLRKQYGTFWYHAHHQNLKADGILGPLIIHSPEDPLKRGVDFDQEIVLILTDWYHTMSSEIVRQMRSPKGYMGSAAAPSPNSALMNGVGEYNCRFATKSERCKTTSPPEFSVVAGNKVRFRIIGGGSLAMFYFSADQHVLNVTEADATPVHGPTGIHRVKLHNGQRYSAIVTIGEKEAGSSFYIRGTMESDCWSWVNNDVQLTAYGIVRVSASNGYIDPRSSQERPVSRDWKEQPDGSCVDLNPNELSPIIPVSPPKKVAGTGQFTSAFGFRSIFNSSQIAPDAAPPTPGTVIPGMKKRQVQITTADGSAPRGNAPLPAPITLNAGPPPIPKNGVARWFVNNVTWEAFTYQPILFDLTPGGVGRVNETRVTSVTFPTAEWYDLYLVNTDAGLNHPFHLHGMDMHLVAFGTGLPTPDVLSKLQYRTDNPLRRDTVMVEGGSFVVARVRADLVGVWMMHCHMGWHLSGVVHPDDIKKMKIPERSRAMCNVPGGGSRDQTQPGR